MLSEGANRGPTTAAKGTHQNLLINGAKVTYSQPPNSRRRRRRRRRWSRKLTNIGELFEFELNFIKIFAGFLFDERINRYLSLVYKLVLILSSRYVLMKDFVIYDRIKAKSDAILRTKDFFMISYSLVATCSLVNCFVSSMRHKKLFSILLRKPLDARYFQGPIEVPLTSRRREQKPVQIFAAKINSQHEHKRKNSLMIPNDSNPNQIRWQEYFVPFKAAVQASSSTNFGGISKVKLARSIFFLLLFLDGFSATLRVQFYRAHKQLEMSRELGATNGSSSSTNSSTLAVQLATAGVEHVASFRRESLENMIENLEQLAQWLLQSAFKVVESIPLFLYYTMLASFNTMQFYGQILVAFFIVAALSDLLQRASEQELLKVLNYDRQLAGDGEPAPHRGNEPWQGHQELEMVALRTTDLLIQVRDVLILLRSVISFDYLLLQVCDVCRQMALFSLFVSFVASNDYDWLGMLSFDFVRLALIDLILRIGYHWLHEEAHRLCSISERRLIESSLKDDHHGEQHETAQRIFNVTGEFHSNNNNNKPTIEQRAAIQRRLLLDRTTRLEASTNFRLAEEIEQLWPTDWLTPDLPSYLSQNVFVVTSVCGIQQMYDVGGRVEPGST